MKKTQINNKPLILGRKVSRRDFIRGSAALGIAGTTAGTLLTTGNAFAAGENVEGDCVQVLLMDLQQIR